MLGDLTVTPGCNRPNEYYCQVLGVGTDTGDAVASVLLFFDRPEVRLYQHSSLVSSALLMFVQQHPHNSGITSRSHSGALPMSGCSEGPTVALAEECMSPCTGTCTCQHRPLAGGKVCVQCGGGLSALLCGAQGAAVPSCQACSSPASPLPLLAASLVCSSSESCVLAFH